MLPPRRNLNGGPNNADAHDEYYPIYSSTVFAFSIVSVAAQPASASSGSVTGESRGQAGRPRVQIRAVTIAISPGSRSRSNGTSAFGGKMKVIGGKTRCQTARPQSQHPQKPH